MYSSRVSTLVSCSKYYSASFLNKSGQVWTSRDKSGQVSTSLDKSGQAITTHGSANLFFLIRNFYSSNYYQQSSVYWLKSFARPPWHTFLLNENVLLRELVVLLLHTVPNPNFCVHFFGLKMTNGQGKTFHMVPMH